jgi:hypothetical protein
VSRDCFQYRPTVYATVYGEHIERVARFFAGGSDLQSVFLQHFNNRYGAHFILTRRLRARSNFSDGKHLVSPVIVSSFCCDKTRAMNMLYISLSIFVPPTRQAEGCTNLRHNKRLSFEPN